MVVYILFIN